MEIFVPFTPFFLTFLASCRAAGDPHYTTFDKKRINFLLCEYILPEDCSADKSFRVWTKDVACGSRESGASCVFFVRILVGDVEIKLTRNLRTAIVNGSKVTQFPFKRTGKSLDSSRYYYELLNLTKQTQSFGKFSIMFAFCFRFILSR